MKRNSTKSKPALVKLSISMPTDLYTKVKERTKSTGESNFSLYIRSVIKKDLNGDIEHKAQPA
jgi:NRPS condensation-like uncharacterized protein